MADLDRYLRRFRRLVSPPGRPGPAGTAFDPQQRVRAELGEVFAAIDAVEQEVARIRDDAEQRVAHRREDARDRASRIVATAREGAEQERIEAATTHRDRVDRDVTASEERARQEADRVRSRTDERLEDLAGRLVDRVLGAEFELTREGAG